MPLPPYNYDDYDDTVLSFPEQAEPQLNPADVQGQLSMDPMGNELVSSDQAPPLVMPADEAAGVLTPEAM
ncbi:MAG: hypothetical protein DRQ35_07105, partial [Gammaproteobacteria bacterium]